MNERIDIKNVIVMLKRNIWWILAIIAITVASMFIYLNYIVTPIYQKSTQILVNQAENNQTNSIEAQTVQADLQLVNTYSTIISSPRILTKVQGELKGKYNLQELTEMISVKNTTNSQIIDINVNYLDAKTATDIVNVVTQVFTQEISEIMKISNVTILSEAQFFGNEKPVKPQKALLLVLAFFSGILLAVCFIFVKLLFERRFVSTEELEEYLGISVLGEVSVFQNGTLF
ncbi:YveK family protein [Vagococcus sp.]|uniref:YveK family protein n=1 Tax=Vagococcus sp. TaxID=1933889 RepID=UPI002FC73E49